MKRLITITFTLLWVFNLCAADATPTATKYKAKNVVLIVIDGPRFTEFWGEPEKKYIPHIAKDLAPQAVVYENFRNEGYTITDPGHCALTTGFYFMIDNTGKELPPHPTILQRWLKFSGQPASSAWSICSKDKLYILTNSADPEWHDKFVASADCGLKKADGKMGMRDDIDTLKSVTTIMERDHPRAVVVNFRAPDSNGHAKNWEGYLEGIKTSDEYAWKIWQFIQSNDFYKDQTAFFISDDHGRHLDGILDSFVSHGDGCPGCRKIFGLAAGPDFKKGLVSKIPRQQIDIAVTMAEILGFPIPESKGVVLSEIFTGNPDVPADAPTTSAPMFPAKPK